MIAKTIATAFNERVRRERFCARRTLIVNVPLHRQQRLPGHPILVWFRPRRHQSGRHSKGDRLHYHHPSSL